MARSLEDRVKDTLGAHAWMAICLQHDLDAAREELAALKATAEPPSRPADASNVLQMDATRTSTHDVAV